MICGVCGGTVRGYAGRLHGRPIKDWKHASVPPGTEPHRPVLGTPVDEPTLERIREDRRRALAEKTEKKAKVAAPLVRPRLAKQSELTSSAQRLQETAEEYGWTVEPIRYWQAASGWETLLLRGRRRDLGFVAVWERRPENKTPKWAFDQGWRLASGRAQQVGSDSLKSWLTARDEQCPECDRSAVAHDEGKCPS